MKRVVTTLLISFLLVSCSGRLEFSPYTVISVENQEQKEAADWFAWLFAAPGGFVPIVLLQDDAADIVLRHDSSIQESNYRLDIDRNKIYITASETSGFKLAFQALRSLLPAEISSTRHADYVAWTVPVMDIYAH